MTEGSMLIDVERWSVHMCECVCVREKKEDRRMEKRKVRRKGKWRLIYKGYHKRINSSYLWMVGLWMV